MSAGKSGAGRYRVVPSGRQEMFAATAIRGHAGRIEKDLRGTETALDVSAVGWTAPTSIFDLSRRRCQRESVREVVRVPEMGKEAFTTVG